jgi:hypothetical protein
VLKWLRSIDWIPILSSVAILFAALLFIPKTPHTETIGTPYEQPNEVAAPTSPDERLVNYTRELADYTLGLEIFTALVAVFGGFEIWLLFRTDSTARQTVRVGLRQAVISRRQVALTGAQADILDKQKEIERQAFIITHRPILRVRHVSLVLLNVGPPTDFFMHGDKISGGLVVVNAGGSVATITESFCRIFFSQTELPMRSPLDRRHEMLFEPQAPPLGIGESRALIRSHDAHGLVNIARVQINTTRGIIEQYVVAKTNVPIAIDRYEHVIAHQEIETVRWRDVRGNPVCP